MFAVLDTLLDARVAALQAVLSGLSARGGGLHGGRYDAGSGLDGGLRLRRYAYLSGPAGDGPVDDESGQAVGTVAWTARAARAACCAWTSGAARRGASAAARSASAPAAHEGVGGRGPHGGARSRRPDGPSLGAPRHTRRRAGCARASGGGRMRRRAHGTGNVRRMERDPNQHTDDGFVAEEEAAAAAEAAGIGGAAGDEDLDPAERPVREAGGGEAEGFEMAEDDLVEHASHGDQHSAPPTAAHRALRGGGRDRRRRRSRQREPHGGGRPQRRLEMSRSGLAAAPAVAAALLAAAPATQSR